MAGKPGEDLDALAAHPSGMADGAPPEELRVGAAAGAVDVNAILRAFGQGVVEDNGLVGGASASSRQRSRSQEPQNHRARNLARAREAKAKKRALALSEASRAQRAGSASSSAIVPFRPTPQGGQPIVVPTAILQTIESGKRAASGSPHLQAALHAALANFDANKQPVDEDVATIVQAYLKCESAKVETKDAFADRLGLKRMKVERVVPCVFDTLVVLELLWRRKVEQHFARFAQGLVYVDACRYDETPLFATTKDIRYLIQPRSAAAPSQTTRPAVVQRSVVGSDVGVSKLFQAECMYGMFGKASLHPGAPADAVAIKGMCLTTIQDLERNSAEVYQEALMRVSCPSTAAAAFLLPTRLATSDKSAANLKAEKALVSERGPCWKGISLTCDMHTAAGCHTKTSVLVAEDITGVLHIALSLCSSGYMRKFRRCVFDDVKDRLVFLHGRPPISAEEYRLYIFNVFLPDTPQNKLKRTLAQLYLPGDWRNDDEIEYYFHTPGTDDRLSEECLRISIAQGIVRTLVNRQPAIYRRDRWVGFEMSLDQLGILEAAHGILRHSFRRFCADIVARPSSIATPRASASSPALDGATTGAGISSAMGSGGCAEQGCGELALEGAGPSAGAHEESPDWARQNENHRKIASSFLSGKPLGRIMIIRQVFEPFRTMLHKLIHLGSDAWEKRQEANEARFLMGEEVPDRHFRIVRAALHEVEHEFCTQVAALGAPSNWKHLPDDCHDMATQGLLFRLLSRAGSAADALLREPHATFPIRLFTILADPGMAEVLQLAPRCEMCEWSKAFCDTFDLESDDARKALRFLASMAYLDIVQIEQRHAPLRLRAKVMAPTNIPSTGDLAAFWTARQFRARHNSGRSASKRTNIMGALKPGTASTSEVQKSKTKKGGGGPWRAYIRQQCHGRRKADFKQLKAEYWRLSDEERSELLRSGRLATKAYPLTKAGASAFGARTRHAHRLATKRLSQQRLRRQLGQQIDPGCFVSVGEVLALTGGSVADTQAIAKLARAHSRQEFSILRAAASADLEAINKYEAHAGKEMQETVLRSAPGLRAAAASFRPIPDRDLRILEAKADFTEDIQKVVSMALRQPKKSNLWQALKLDWEQRLRPISGRVGSVAASPEAEPLAAPAHANGSECHRVGRCICDAEGKKLLRLSKSFLRSFKTFVKKGTEARTSMLQGRSVLKLRWELCQVAGARSNVKGGRAALASDEGARSGDVWWHISWVRLSPYTPNFQVLEPDSAQQEDGRVALRASWSFLSFWNAMEALEKDLSWSMEFCTMIESLFPVAEVDPAVVFVQAKTGKTVTFWNAQKATGRLNSRPPAETGVGGGASPDDIARALLGALEDQGGPEGAGAVADRDGDDAASVGSQNMSESEGSRASAEEGIEQLEELLASLMEEEAAEAMAGGEDPSQSLPPEVETVAAPPPASTAASDPAAGADAPGAASAGSQAVQTTKSVAIKFFGGSLQYYFKGCRFQAVCGNPAHGRCVLTRSSRPGVSGKLGRPLGLMAAWLRQSGVDSQQQHVYLPTPTFEQRVEARNELQRISGATVLFAHERPQLEHEGDEPDIAD